jgi:predicted MPP superfamily phosphohydrolase
MNNIIYVIMIIILAAIILCLIDSIYDSNRFVVRRYTVKNPRIRKNIRICHLSDIHGHLYGQDNERLMNAIVEAAPDIIIISGDTIVGNAPVKTWEKERIFLQRLSAEFPVYAINGNHESKMLWYSDAYPGVYDKYKKDLSDFGITLLLNESCVLDEYGIRLTGIELEHYYFGKFYKHSMPQNHMNSIAGCRDGEKLNILIAHNPQYFEEYCEWGADIVFSGHIHGGIIRLPLLGGVISPAVILFPKYDGGLFRHGSQVMILSRGLGTHTIPVRVFNPGELVITDIIKE